MLDIKEKRRLYRLKNIVRIRECQKISDRKRAEKRKEYDKLYAIRYRERRKVLNKFYCSSHAEQRRLRDKQRRKLDVRFKLNAYFSSAVSEALAFNKGGRTWQNLVGYTLSDLHNHLEKQFKSGMTWQNYGSYWHVDHIIPKSFFKYKSHDDVAFIKCWALSNLQPLERMANFRKAARLPEELL